MNITKYLPNALTLLNLFLGCIAIVFAFDAQLHIAAILVIFSTFLDFMDGFTARLFKAYSAMGKELDSLADLVSFGVAPSVVAFVYLEKIAPPDSITFYGFNLISFSGFIIAVFSALRLAMFNTDTKQTEKFYGLPTPANALFFVSIPLVLFFDDGSSFSYFLFYSITNNHFYLLAVILVFSLLTVLPIPLLSLKFKNFSFSGNSERYVFIVVSLLLFILMGVSALPFVIIGYILISILFNLLKFRN